MRKLASFDDPDLARLSADALCGAEIEAEVRPASDGSHTLWVRRESDLPAAKALVEEVMRDPSDPRLRSAARQAKELRSAHAREARSSRHRVIDARERLHERSVRGAPVTLLLLVVSAGVGFATQLGARADLVARLTIDIDGGEPWRVLSPIFLHFGVLHLLFNTFWLVDLGTAIERFQGSWRFALFVSLCAALSNLAQLYLGGTTRFGGLSGVVYALVGYLWARGRFDPSCPIGAPPQLVTFFLVWLALGFSGLLGSTFGRTADYCHLGGLASGAAYGFAAARVAVRRAGRR